MGLRLVNLLPGSASDYTKPNQPLQMGLKSDGVLGSPKGSVRLGTLRMSLGYTSLQNEGLLPENSLVLPKAEATVGLDTAERVRPIGAPVTRFPFGTGIKMVVPGTSSPVGVYSVKAQVENNAGVLGYFKFKTNTAWSLATRDWCNLTDMTGMYFGLEYGPANTICWASLRGNPGPGSLVIGGPMQTFLSARPAQRQINAFNWLALPNGTVVEMWIVFSMAGYPSPFVPAYTPVVEVWTKRAGVDTVPVCHTLATPLPVASLGTFPSSTAQFPNWRAGSSDSATLFFGNVGGGADALEVLDWALFPDYRVAVMEGVAVGSNRLAVLPDGPVLYSSSDGRPQDVFPAKWFPMTDVGFVPPSANLFTPPTRSVPTYVSLEKTAPTGAGFHREEPRLERLEDGAVIEAFMSAELTSRPGESLGVGLAIDDGTSLFQVVMLESATRRTFGLAKAAGFEGDFVNGYSTPSADTDKFCDWRSPKLVRLVVDRVRYTVSVFVDGVRYINRTLSAVPGSVSPVGGRVAFGHLEASSAQAKLNVSFLSYLTRYVAWELDETLLPDTSPAAFVLDSSGLGSSVLNPSELIITKPEFNSLGTRQFYYKTIPTFDERHGLQADFRVKVKSYTDRIGTAFAKSTLVGSGIQVFLGNKRLHLGFFDCGASGRFVGIVPGSGTADDLVNQTALGKKFSAPIEWTLATTYRLTYRPYQSIDVWVNNIPSGPVISIPWRDDTNGFDLPTDSSIAAVAFGHFEEDTSSETSWEFFRYGFSNGYEVAVEPLFENGLRGYLFGGRSLIQTEFDE